MNRARYILMVAMVLLTSCTAGPVSTPTSWSFPTKIFDGGLTIDETKWVSWEEGQERVYTLPSGSVFHMTYEDGKVKVTLDPAVEVKDQAVVEATYELTKYSLLLVPMATDMSTLEVFKVLICGPVLVFTDPTGGVWFNDQYKDFCLYIEEPLEPGKYPSEWYQTG